MYIKFWKYTPLPDSRRCCIAWKPFEGVLEFIRADAETAANSIGVALSQHGRGWQYTEVFKDALSRSIFLQVVDGLKFMHEKVNVAHAAKVGCVSPRALTWLEVSRRSTSYPDGCVKMLNCHDAMQKVIHRDLKPENILVKEILDSGDLLTMLSDSSMELSPAWHDRGSDMLSSSPGQSY
eukprot:3552840-Amphidinium_carterae.1